MNPPSKSAQHKIRKITVMKTNTKRIAKSLTTTALFAASVACLWTAFAPRAEAESCIDWCIRQHMESKTTCYRQYQTAAEPRNNA